MHLAIRYQCGRSLFSFRCSLDGLYFFYASRYQRCLLVHLQRTLPFVWWREKTRLVFYLEMFLVSFVLLLECKSFSWVFIKLWNKFCLSRTSRFTNSNMWKCKVIPEEQNIVKERTNNIFRESFMICPFEMMVEWSSKRSTLFCPLHRIWSRKNFLGRATI